jgi:hypothetical protein
VSSGAPSARRSPPTSTTGPSRARRAASSSSSTRRRASPRPAAPRHSSTSTRARGSTGASSSRRTPAERFWYAIDVAIARAHGVALRGAEPAVLLPELPPALVVRALGEALDWFVANDRAGVATVLAACRARAWAADGRWRSKRDAAAWAAARSAVPGTIERAVAARADPAARVERGAVEAAVAEARASLAGA